MSSAAMAAPGSRFRGSTSRLWSGIVLCAILGLQTSACADADRTDRTGLTAGLLREDSAGVELIRGSRSILDTLPVWSIGPEPLLSVGEADADPDQHFGRIAAAIRLEDGGIVVVDGLSFVFSLFSGGGELVRRFGGRGDGPGEFQGVGKVRLLDEGRIGILDTHSRRLSVLDSNGSVVRTTPFPCAPGGPVPRGEPAPCYAVDILGNGTVLANATQRAGPSPTPALDEFQDDPPGTIVLALATDEVVQIVDSVAVAGRTRIVVERGGSRAVWGTKELFAPDGRWTATRSGMVVGAGDRYELRYFTANGRLQRVVRLTGEPERASRGHVEAISEWSETIESALASEFAQRYLETVEIDRPLPPFGELRSDGAGRIWAADYFPPSPLGPPESILWTVFSEDGVPIARIATGSARDVLDIGGDYILVRETDALNVEHVALYSRDAAGPGA